MLFQQLHVGDDHAAVYRFAHVVDGEQGHLHGGEGFHFHTSLAIDLGGGGAGHAAGGGLHFKIHGHTGQGDRVAQGDQVTGFLGSLDACDAGDAQHIPFLGGAGRDQFQCGRQHVDLAPGHRHTARGGFVSHVDHVGLALGIKMGQDSLAHARFSGVGDRFIASVHHTGLGYDADCFETH